MHSIGVPGSVNSGVGDIRRMLEERATVEQDLVLG